jgi:hypothetical protein
MRIRIRTSDKVKQMSKKVLIQGLTKSHSISDRKPTYHQCCGSMKFWYGSGHPDADPDPHL